MCLLPMQEKNYYAAALENLRKAYRDHKPVKQSRSCTVCIRSSIEPNCYVDHCAQHALCLSLFFISMLFLRQQTNDSVDSESKELDPTSAEASASDQWWQSDDYQAYHEQVAYEEGCHKSAVHLSRCGNSCRNANEPSHLTRVA